MRSTCLMEPGDSGGPVFDLNGMVIGIHSKIELSLDNNYEVPIKVFRKYWNALIIPKTYTELPDSSTILPIIVKAPISTISGVEDFGKNMDRVNKKIKETSFIIKSSVADREQRIVGTLFLLNKKRYLVSKNSMVAEKPMVELGNGKVANLIVLHRDEANDLVLLGMNSSVKGGIDLKSISTAKVEADLPGKILISRMPSMDAVVGILSNLKVDIPSKENLGYMGINIGMKDGKVIINRIQSNSPARRAKLEIGDQLSVMNGLKIKNSAEYIAELKKFKPDDSILIHVNRGMEEFTKMIILKSADDINGHIANRFTDGKSERRFGFKAVFAHDSRIKPAECGGPIFDLDGQFYGLNIARFSRTTSLAIPASTVEAFIRMSR